MPVKKYDWFGADGETILRLAASRGRPVGLGARATASTSPRLERALDRAVRALPAATVECGWSAEALEQADDHVELTLRRVREPQIGVLEPTAETKTVRARYVVGADGANSFVRTAAGIGFEDQGFAESWLVVDLRPDDVEALSYLPAPCQWCDPERPHMHTRQRPRRTGASSSCSCPASGPRTSPTRRASGSCWRRGSRRTTERIVRHAVYEFRGAPGRHHARRSRRCSPATPRTRCRRSWARDCAPGVRDAASLAWRLDLVLRGAGGDELLDAYTTERRPQNEWIVNLSTEMGRVSCTLDPQTAAERDAALRAAAAPPPLALPPLAGGHRSRRVARWPAAAPCRAPSASAGREGRFDDVVGKGFVLLARRAADLPAPHVAFLGAPRRAAPSPSTSSTTSTAA